VLYYATTARHRHLVDDFLAGRGRALRGRLEPVAYERLLAARRVPEGHYLFADLERLGPRAAERAARLHAALAAAPGAGRLINHPTRASRRYELLRRLHDAGLNQSDVQRVTEGRLPRRWPVFVRRENDHAGSRTDLLRDPSELRAALDALDRRGASREDAIICEFCDTADERGIYRKFGAFLVGGRVIPRHLFFSRRWIVKDADLAEPELLREEREYLERSPHEEAVCRAFALARIEYGRIDYSLRPDGIEVWEINTHPILPAAESHGGPQREAVNAEFARRLVEALGRIADESVGRGRVTVGPGRGWPERARAGLRRVLRRG
jgi:hypothetical protein